MKNMIIEFSIHFFLLSYINCNNLIRNSYRNDVFTQKGLFSKHKTPQYYRENPNVGLLFLNHHPSNRFRNHPKWYKNKNQITPIEPAHTPRNTIENNQESKRIDTTKKITNTEQLSTIKPQWMVPAKRAFGYNKYFTFSEKYTPKIVSAETTTEETEYFLEAWPTFTFKNPSFFPTETTKTVKIKAYKALFQSTTKNYFRNFVESHFPSTVSSWDDKKVFSRIDDKIHYNVSTKNVTFGAFLTKNDDVEIKINQMLNYLKNDPALKHSSSQPVNDNQAQNSFPTYTLPVDTRNLTFAPSRTKIDDTEILINYILKSLQNEPAFTQSPLQLMKDKALVKNIGRTSKENNTEPISKCYSCGWYEEDIPNTDCYSIFGAAAPIDVDRGKRIFFKTHCYKNKDTKKSTFDTKGDTFKEHYEKNHIQKSPYYIEGCFKRFTDVGAQNYYELGCRAWPPVRGRSFASRRFQKVEAMLQGQREGCASSPHASLTPFSRGIYLWVRYHVCVCQGRYCNAQPQLLPVSSSFVFVLFIHCVSHRYL